MVTLGPGDKLTSGVPMGGIGAGKVEINNIGKMVNLSIANSWGRPRRWMRGFHVMVAPSDSVPFFLEYGLPMKRFYGYEPDSMEYVGRYPFTELRAKKGAVEATLEAFSPIIPHNLPDSTIPTLGMTVTVHGSRQGRVAVALSNIAGTLSTGRINRQIDGGVKFTNPRTNEYDPTRGELSLLAEHLSGRYVQYNLNGSAEVSLAEKRGKQSYETDQPWSSIIKGAEFVDDPHEVIGQWDNPGGLVLSDYREGDELRFVFSWYFTGRGALYPYGHYYHTRFGGAEEVGRYTLKEFGRLRNQSREWHQALIRKDLPEWLRDAMINSAYVLSSSSWLDDRGRFAMYEATTNAQQLGAIASFTSEVGSLPVLEMFPELEKEFLERAIKNPGVDGYVLHDFGINSLDHPTGGGTYPPGWKDVGPVFSLMVYRYALRTGDLELLAEAYPKMLKSVEWSLRQDKDGDGIPDMEGHGDNGFDAMSVKGRDSYVGSLFVASLIALRESSRLLGKADDTARISEQLGRARKSFSDLHNGRYFRAWTGAPISEGYVFLAQLAGDWWTTILGLEPVADRAKIESAYEALLNVNAATSRFCTPNIVHENGRILDFSVQAYSSWPRLVFCLAGARFLAGDQRWLPVAKKEWDNLVAQGLAWDHPSRVDGRTGKPDPEDDYLDHFIGSPALWTFNTRGQGH